MFNFQKEYGSNLVLSMTVRWF